MKTAFIDRKLIWCGVLACAMWHSLPQAAAAGTESSDYRIEPLDTIFVDILGETNLCRECKVQASGEITFPHLGSVKVAEQTTVEVQKKLRDLLAKDYLVNPQVTVTVKTYNQRSVSVLGQVTKPGAYIIPEEQKWSIVDAIAQAGGLTKLAKKRKQIEFTRNGVLKTFDFDKLTRDQNNPGKVVWLQPGDLIKVLESAF